MPNKKLLFKGQSLFLSLTLLASTLLPQGTLAQGTEQLPVSTEIKHLQDTSFDTSPKEKHELPEYRTERSKRFQNPDGSFTEQIYNQPIHYKDPTNNKWETIDSDLTLDEQGDLQNNDPRFKVKLKTTANAGFMSFSKDGGTVSFRPDFAGAAKGEPKNNKLKYTNATTDTDLTYTVLTDGVKEDIILKSPNAPSSFTFEMKIENLTYELSSEGEVLFFKNGETTPLFTMAKPFMVDADRRYSQAVQYSIHKETPNKIWVDVKADPAWLKAADRKYPVTIDPPIRYAASSDTFVEFNNPNLKPHSYLHNLIGNCVDHGTTRSLFQFDLPTLASGTVITDAKFHVFNEYTYVNDNPIIDVRPINASWLASTMHWTENETLAKGNVVASATATIAPDAMDWIDIPMTNLVQDWYNGTQGLFGFEMRYRDESKVCRQLVSTDDPDRGFHPHLELTYTLDGLGAQPFWTFDGPVNMVNRNLVLSATDISYQGRQAALTLSRTYNSRSTQAGVFGFGWSSMLDMRIYYAAKGPARLVDNGGTTHYFHQNPDGTYEPMSGLNWNLTVSGTTAIVTTKEQTKYTFSNDRLTNVENANGNALHIYYYTNETLLQDDAGNSIKFTLSGGRVISAQDVANRVWNYKYDTDGNLVQVIAPISDSTFQYRYEKNTHNMTASISPTGNVTYYYYNSDDRTVAINPVNAVINSNFEVDSDGDATPDHFTYKEGLTGLAVDSAAGSPYQKAGKLSLTTPGSSNYKVYRSNAISVDPTKSYTVSAAMKAVRNAGVQKAVLSVLAYRADGVYIGELGRTELQINELGQTEVIGTETPVENLPNEWKKIANTMPTGKPNALPSGAHTVYVKIAASNLTGSGTSWFDGVQFEEKSTASQFVSGDQYTANIPGMQTARYDVDGIKELYQYNDNQNLTEYRQDPQNYNLITKYGWDNNKLSSVTDPKGAVSSKQHDTNGNVIQSTDASGAQKSFVYDGQNNLTQSTGSISGQQYLYTYDNARHQKTSRDPYTTSRAQGHDSFGNKTNETNLLGWADNLVDNSGFEGSSNADDTPLRYVFNEGQSNQWSLTSDVASGGKSLKITASSANANNFTVLVSDLIPVNSSDYVLSASLKTENASGNQLSILSLYAYNSLGARIGEVGRINAQNQLNEWQRYSVPIRKADLPAGTAQVRIKLAAKNAEGSGASLFDSIQLQKNPIDTAYNLIDNSSFERGTSGGVSRWTRLNSTAGTFNWLTSPVYAGARSVAISNAVGDNGFTYDQHIPYDPKKAYNFSAFVKTENLSSNVAHLRIEFYKADKSKILTSGEISSVKIGGTADWKRLFVELAAGKAPLETAFIRPVLASGASTGTVYFDNVRLQEGGVTTRYLYDASTNYTRMTQMTNALGNTTNYQYDQVGNLRFVTSPLNVTTETQYDAMNRKTAILPAGEEEQIKREYNSDGNLKAIRTMDRTGVTEYSATQMTYHPTGQVATSEDPNHNVRSYFYTPGGRLQKIQYPTSESISYAYSPVGQISHVLYNEDNRYTYGYDKNGNVSSVWDSLQSVEIKAYYDNMNRITNLSNPVRVIDYSRDSEGNVTQQVLKIKTPTSTTVDKTQTIQYNLVNQPTSLTDVSGTHKFLYNEHGKLSTVQLGNQVTERRTFDSVGNVTQVINQNADGKTISAYSYQYDADGNLKSVTDHYGQELVYEYDPSGRLKKEKLPSGNFASYSYDRTVDPLGNRTLREETHPDGNIVLKTSYTYDLASQLKSTNAGPEWVYNKRGYLTSNETYSFQWDAAGRLTSVTKLNDSTPLATYQYDYLNRRVQQTVGDETTNFFYEGTSNRVLAEYDQNGTPKKYYVWGPNGRLLSLNVEGTTYYPLYNGHGDIIQLTNASGAVVAWYQYDAWGNMTAHSDDTDIWSKNPYRYAGYRFDDVTGLYYLNARYYDSAVGRFLSPDPVFETQEYSYALDNPVQVSDPTGYRPLCLCEGEDIVPPAYDPYAAELESMINSFARPAADIIGERLMESSHAGIRTMGFATVGLMMVSDIKGEIRAQSCNCFTLGTKVLTDQGEKPIEEIQIGDKVLSKDDATGESGYKEVEWLYQRKVDVTYSLAVGGEIITTTDEHPFWIADKGWVETKNLLAGDVLTTSDGSLLPIEKIEIQQGHATVVYNFKVKDFHTYFVSNLKIWTHNSCGYSTIVESKDASRTLDGLSEKHQATISNALSGLASKRHSGLNVHRLTDGRWAADIKGFGKGRGRGRIIFTEKDGVISISEINLKHYK